MSYSPSLHPHSFKPINRYALRIVFEQLGSFHFKVKRKRTPQVTFIRLHSVSRQQQRSTSVILAVLGGIAKALRRAIGKVVLPSSFRFIVRISLHFSVLHHTREHRDTAVTTLKSDMPALLGASFRIHRSIPGVLKMVFRAATSHLNSLSLPMG